MQNLLSDTPPVLLPGDPAAESALAEASRGAEPDAAGLKAVAARFPTYSAAWASLADLALAADDPVTAYAYARTGYHRGLDQLRRSGWRGHGPVPWSHKPNRGFLRCVHALRSGPARRSRSGRSCACSRR